MCTRGKSNESDFFFFCRPGVFSRIGWPGTACLLSPAGPGRCQQAIDDRDGGTEGQWRTVCASSGDCCEGQGEQQERGGSGLDLLWRECHPAESATGAADRRWCALQPGAAPAGAAEIHQPAAADHRGGRGLYAERNGPADGSVHDGPREDGADASAADLRAGSEREPVFLAERFDQEVACAHSGGAARGGDDHRRHRPV